MTKQEAYEKMREFFSRPGAVLAVERMTHNPDKFKCVYRGGAEATSPVRCAIGCLIPDEQYDPWFDEHGDITGKGILDLDEAGRLPAVIEDSIQACGYDDFLDFLETCQSAHDRIGINQGTTGAFVRDLDAIAERYGLKVAT